MANYKLHYGLQAEYDAKKLAGTLVQDDLYFTSDTLNIYKGDNLLSAAVEAVTTFPATGAQGRFYVNPDTLETKIWNGSAWTVVSPAVATTLDADTAAGNLVTAGAIRSYVDGIAGGAGLIKDVAYAEATQTITITYGDNTTKDMPLKELLTGAAYDATTGDFTFTKANGDAVVVNTPKENFLQAAAYDQATHILTLTLTDGTAVTVDLGELIDVYTVADTDTVDMTLTDGEIKADVKVSADANNVLEAKADGLYVAAPAEALIKSVEATETVGLEVDANGALKAAAKVSAEAGNTLEAKADGLYVAPTDLSNYYTKDEVYAKTETYTKDEVDAAILASHTWEAI